MDRQRYTKYYNSILEYLVMLDGPIETDDGDDEEKDPGGRDSSDDGQRFDDRRGLADRRSADQDEGNDLEGRHTWFSGLTCSSDS